MGNAAGEMLGKGLWQLQGYRVWQLKVGLHGFNWCSFRDNHRKR